MRKSVNVLLGIRFLVKEDFTLTFEKMKNLFATLIIVLFSLGSTSFTPVDENSNNIIATWVYSDYNNGIIEYVRAKKFKQNKPGIEFQKDGKLRKRQNSGWCGTPPINYKNETGYWKFNPDSTLSINYTYWGGKMQEDWQIIEISPEILKIKPIEHNLQEE